MKVTIHLSPDAERLLRERAAREGQIIVTIAAALLADALARDAEDSANAEEGIRRGLEDFAAGRSRTFQEFAAEQRRKHPPPAADSAHGEPPLAGEPTSQDET